MASTLATACKKFTLSSEKGLRLWVCAPRTPKGLSLSAITTVMPLTTPCSRSSGGGVKRISALRSSRGWEAVAGYALEWAQEHATTRPAV
jgi:hypothetical protein